MNLASYRAFQGRLRQLIGETRTLADDLGFSGLVQVCQELDRRLAEERFFVSVLGEIKRGKSTLINALLGADLLPKAALVCTATLCIVRYGPAPRAVIHYREGGSREVPPEDLRQIATKKNPEAAKIAHLEIEYPLPLLQDGVVLVDTPGVNDTDEVRRRLTEEFIPRSDGVLFVLNAGQPFSDSEMRFLTSGILKYHIRKLWFVVNALDRLASDEQREEALAYCQEQLDQVLPDARLHGVSARVFLEARQAGDAARAAASGIPDFLDALARDLVEGRWAGLIDVPLGLFGSYLAELERGIAWEASLLEKTSSQRSDMAAGLEQECQAVLAEKVRLEKRFSLEAESLVFEIARGTAQPALDGLPQAICLVLQMDETDERKQKELGHLFRDRLQSFVQGLVDELARRLAPLAGQLSAELARAVARLDSRADPSGAAGTAGGRAPVALPRLPALVEPDLGGSSLLARLAPLVSLGFLLHGNILLAAAALTPSFFRRLGADAAPEVIKSFREQLTEGAAQAKAQFLARKTEVARELAAHLLQGFGPLMRLVEDATARARRLAGEADA
ncbi:MAG: hypothetical protein GX442_04365, partial [Candidatus Riflebacteria bacterium]|nr:hypothetical protein [Candidatus Riflebacteria bacterium]